MAGTLISRHWIDRESNRHIIVLVNYTDILEALRELIARERIEFLPLAPDAKPVSPYAPIQKYVLDLKNGAKPETAAEDLFTALCKDILAFQPTRQVGTAEGWVDFMLPERKGEPLPLELKPLFQRDGPDALWRGDANPKQHVTQVKKYLRDHEYLILTDLRTAWFFNARDFFFENKPFAELPFPDFIARCRETGSVLDTLRRVEDTADKPELEQQFFEDLKTWFNEFAKVKWNKCIFGKSYEMFLAANRKDEGIYYTPAAITAPMAESLVNSLAGKLVDDICAAVGSQQCEFARAEQLMAQLAEIRVADTACGSGGFLIKVLRSFWQQYQRIDQASAWLQKILRPENGELYLAELPPNVEAALGFRRRWKLDDRRELASAVAERHLRCQTPQRVPRSVATLVLCRGIIPLCGETLHFRELTGTRRAFPDLRRVFGVN